MHPDVVSAPGGGSVACRAEEARPLPSHLTSVTGRGSRGCSQAEGTAGWGRVLAALLSLGSHLGDLGREDKTPVSQCGLMQPWSSKLPSFPSADTGSGK